MSLRSLACYLSALACLTLPVGEAEAAEVQSLIETIKAVGQEGKGNQAAAKAWNELAREGPNALVPVLRALNGSSPVAANWLQAAVDAIAERSLQGGEPLPVEELERFLKDTSQDPKARRRAYEWLARVDKNIPTRFLPTMLQDPSVELRRDAVAVILEEARVQFEKDMKPAAVAAYRKALEGARDRDQVDLIAKQLKSLGHEVDLPAHFGFVRRWALVGPFEHSGGVGFKAEYPPERGTDLSATYEGKKEARLRWLEHSTTDNYGVVDLNKAIAKHMGAVAYAYAVVESPTERPVEIRVGSNNAVKIFLNGKQVFSHEEYHHNNKMDQYIARGTLRKGKNEILLKICQNEQTEDWAQSWGFQCRLSDAVGGAVPFTVATPAISKAATEGKVQP